MYSHVVDGLRGTAFTAAEIGELTKVSERQVQRWAAGTSKPEAAPRKRLLELQFIVGELREVYTDEGVEIWLHGRNKVLSSRRPVDLLMQGEFDLVLEAVQRLQTGAM